MSDQSEGTRTWVRSVRLGPMQFRLTLLEHSYAPGHGRRWVVQTSTVIDRWGSR